MTPSTIHTDRLVLTPLAPEDAEEMITVLGDERMYGFSGGEPPTLEQLRRRYRRLAEGRSDDGAQLWLNWIARQHSDRAAVGAL